MRSAVSVILSGTAPEQNMSYPDYQQTPHDHQALLVVVRHIGRQLRTKQFNRAFDRISRINNIKILDSQNHPRNIYIRYLRGYPSENNDWGDFQTHRKALGLISVGQCNSQEEFNELCRIHESLKVSYAFTLYDSRCMLYGLNSDGTLYEAQHSSDVSPCVELSEDGFEIGESSTVSNHTAPPKNRNKGAGDVVDNESSISTSVTSNCDNSSSSSDATISKGKSKSSDSLQNYLGTSPEDTLDTTSEDSSSKSESMSTSTGIRYSAVLEPDRTNGSDLVDSEKTGKSLTPPTNFKARTLFYPTMDQCSSLDTDVEEFISSLFWVLESKRLDKLAIKKADRSLLLSSLCAPFEKKDFVGLDLESKNNKRRADGRLKKQLGDLCLQAGLPSEAISNYQAAAEILRSVNDWLWLGGALEGMCSASVNCLYPQLRHMLPFVRTPSLQGSRNENSKHNNECAKSNSNSLPSSIEHDSAVGKVSIKNCLSPFEILERYRECITHYGKYRQAGIIETEASIKASLVLNEQRQILAAADFLQNAVFISLQLSEDEKMHRFNAFSELYTKLGFHRKAAFFKRIAAMRCVSPHNPNPDWSLCHSLLLQSLKGYNLSLDPMEPSRFGFYGWPKIQTQVLQELVGTAKRKGNSALATKHMSLLFHSMLPHMNPDERKEFAHQLETLSKESEGLPVPLAIENGIIVPPVHFNNIPYVKLFKLIAPTPHLKAEKMKDKSKPEEVNPFLYTPFSTHRDRTVKDASKAEFSWLEGEMCEVNLLLENPLAIELKVSSMCLITEGVKFQVNSNTISIPADTTLFNAKLTGKPLEPGTLRILGYTTYTLGVKSNVRLKNLKSVPAPHVDIEIVPALPSIEIETSKPKSEFFSSFSDSIINSASISLLMGQSDQCVVTLKNNGKVPIEQLELSLESRMDRDTKMKIFSWNDEDIVSKLPIQPEESVSFTMNIYGAGEFVGIPQECTVAENSSISSNVGTLTHSSDGPSSLPSRLGAFSERLRAKRTESSASNRSSVKSYGDNYSNGSVSVCTPKLSFSSYVKNYEAVLKFKYSGGPGLKSGYLRQCALSFHVEVSPALFITKWDTLPGDSPSQCYLVLDLCNATQQEMEINYAKTKQILVEKMETCRIPVPLSRCPASKDKGAELTASCDHIVSNVELQWVLPECEGKATLHGITVTPSMAQLITVSPVHWEISVNGKPISTEELRFDTGEMITFNILIRNDLEDFLEQLLLTVGCYQDYQNGKCNYRLDSRLAMLGNESVTISKIEPGSTFQHSLSMVFCMSGSYKMDLKISRKDGLDDCTWRYNPPIDILIN